jgi:hypothetical protein
MAAMDHGVDGDGTPEVADPFEELDGVSEIDVTCPGPSATFRP